MMALFPLCFITLHGGHIIVLDLSVLVTLYSDTFHPPTADDSSHSR